MSEAIDRALERLGAADPIGRAGLGGPLAAGLSASDAAFVAIGGPLEERWHQALRELAQCIRPFAGPEPMLSEGGAYLGTWLESTGTINTEVLARFAPDVAGATHLAFARHQRDDGLFPYKITDAGPAFSQIQMVTPLARTVWNHYLAGGRADRLYLQTMYDAMARHDAWLARYRDTRGTGAVEAFCTFDTGHDLSPRFWFVPDRCFRGDASLFDPSSPILPFVAPDLTANVACQRDYLARIAEELGQDGGPWRAARDASLAALWRECFDAADAMFYDRDATGALVRVQSDVLLRVLACEIGDDEFFAAALERYLANTSKFLAHYGYPSLALDEPRFDRDYTRNSWGGPTNLLSLIRAPQAFEHHGRIAELALSAQPVLAALALADRFPQCLDPWSGAPGFTEGYSPSILWFLDAIDRHCGILERPDGAVWFTGLAPTRLGHGAAAEAIAVRRTIAGRRFALGADDANVVVRRDGEELVAFPRGWRVVADRDGNVTEVVCVAATPVAGELRLGRDATLSLVLEPNERASIAAGVVTGRATPGYTAPRSSSG